VKWDFSAEDLGVRFIEVYNLRSGVFTSSSLGLKI